MRRNHQHARPHIHPPFPSFTWVMTTQENPPSAEHAYGYVQNARRSLKTRLPTYRDPCAPRSSIDSSPARDEKLMETVDYRFQEPLTPKYVVPRPLPLAAVAIANPTCECPETLMTTMDRKEMD
ncbi:hypothetical protein BGW80DRAFT_299667 [Lactifluus volemus]|nr:hypothetical protein BGW80DRAFT_299667 [Lactifluus volemus]